MDLYARVNILDGRAVRLPRGDVHEAIALDNDPSGRVTHWLEQGADYVHVVDLDAAAHGDYKNRPLIDGIIDETPGRIQVAGGIRSHVEAARLIERGAWRIVMGTAAIEDQNMVWDLCRDFPDRITVSLDVRLDEQIATRGWTQNSGRYMEEVLIEMSSAGVAAFMVMRAGRNVLAEPANAVILTEAMATVEEPVIAAGGARDREDLERLLGLSIHGRHLGGLVVGREVTEGRFSLSEAKEIIAAGPPLEPATAAGNGDEPGDPPIMVDMAAADAVEMAAAYESAASAAERAAEQARLAARHFREGDRRQGESAAAAARESVTQAGRHLSESEKPHLV